MTNKSSSSRDKPAENLSWHRHAGLTAFMKAFTDAFVLFDGGLNVVTPAEVKRIKDDAGD